MADNSKTSLQLPFLTFENYEYWKSNIGLYALENDAENYLQQDITPPDAAGRNVGHKPTASSQPQSQTISVFIYHLNF